MREATASRPESLRRALRVLRARHWWYFALLPLASSVDAIWPIAVEVSRAAASIVAAAACLAFAYGLNGVTDRRLDAHDEKNALVGSDEVPRAVVVAVCACALVAIVASATIDSAAVVLVLASLLAGAVYSAPPRLKRFPVFGTIANVAIFAPLPLFASRLALSSGVLALEVAFVVLLTQNQLLHELSDAEEDGRAGVRTTGARLGVAGFRAAAFALGPAAAVVFVRMPLTAPAKASSVLSVVLGAALLFLATPERAGRLRVWHRLSSLVLGVAIYSLLASTRFR